MDVGYEHEIEEAITMPEGPNEAPSADVGPTRAPEPIRGVSRRRFLGRGSMGVVAAGMLTSIPGLSSMLAGASSEAPAVPGDATVVEGDTAGLSQSVVAHVRDVRNGLIDLHINGSTVNVQNPQLARQIARAAR